MNNLVDHVHQHRQVVAAIDLGSQSCRCWPSLSGVEFSCRASCWVQEKYLQAAASLRCLLVDAAFRHVGKHQLDYHHDIFHPQQGWVEQRDMQLALIGRAVK